MSEILVSDALPFDDVQWSRLETAIGNKSFAKVDTSDNEALAVALQTARIVILHDDLDIRFFSAPRLEWVHCNHAGLNKSARPELFDRNILLTGAAGRSAPALAEHAMIFALMLAYRYWRFSKAQEEQEWLTSDDLQGLCALAGRTMGIIGLGHTGCELAKRAKAFDMKVLGFRRRDAVRDANVDRVFCLERGHRLEDMLPLSDVLVLCVNLSDATRHLIGFNELNKLPGGALLINMARGEVVDQEALIAALNSGRLAGAGLDVTTPEPLPRGHKLWNAPNTLITPHFTPPLTNRTTRALDILIENLRRFESGEEMLNALCVDDVYSAR